MHVATARRRRLTPQPSGDARGRSHAELAAEARSQPGGTRLHRPDALVAIDGRELAIEVELTHKRRQRTERIMRELIARYGSVSYFAAPGPRRTLEQLAGGLYARNQRANSRLARGRETMRTGRASEL